MKPENANKTGTSTRRDPNAKFPTPKGGNRKGRVSLIIDLGTQQRKDFEDPVTKEIKPQKPAQQIAVFVDLTHDVVDYGGELGKQPFRLMLNKSFNGELEGINFAAVPPRDAKGQMIEGKKWTYHPASVLTKLAKAASVTKILDGSDLTVTQLLDKTVMVEVEVKETESKDKKDDTGNPVKYTNVNFKGVSSIPLDDDDNPVPVNECLTTPRIVSFKDATVDDIRFIRRDVLRKIKAADNYVGSAMQKAVDAYEAQSDSSQEQKEETAQKPAKVKAAPKEVATVDVGDDDSPF